MTSVDPVAVGLERVAKPAADARSRERYRRVALTAAAGLGARSISVLTVLISVPLAARYLGAERYGVYVTIASLSALLGFADIGLGNGLTNAVSTALGRGDQRKAVAAISSAFAVLCAISLTLLIGIAVATLTVPWAQLLGVSSSAVAHDAEVGVVVFGVCFVVALPLGLVQRAQLACQEAFYGHATVGLANLLSLAGVGLCVVLHAGLPWLVLAIGVAPVVAGVANGAYFFGVRHPELRPSRSAVSSRVGRELLGVGSMFLVLQVAIAIAYQSDAIVLAHLRGPASVAEYAVPMRLFTLIPVVIGLVVSPLWPAYSDALARGDLGWARKAMHRSVGFATGLGGVFAVVLMLTADWIVGWWVGDVVHPSVALIVALGLWAAVMSVSNAYAMFLNGAGILRLQALAVVLMTVANLGASIALTKAFGVSGVVWGTVLAQLLFFLLPFSIYTQRWLARAGTAA